MSTTLADVFGPAHWHPPTIQGTRAPIRPRAEEVRLADHAQITATSARLQRHLKLRSHTFDDRQQHLRIDDLTRPLSEQIQQPSTSTATPSCRSRQIGFSDSCWTLLAETKPAPALRNKIEVVSKDTVPTWLEERSRLGSKRRASIRSFGAAGTSPRTAPPWFAQPSDQPVQG